MAVVKAREVCISFIRECCVKIEDYSNLVLEQDNWLEELYLDSRNKLSASVKGNIILPKTPAVKRGRQGGRKNKHVDQNLLEVVDLEKENIADEQSKEDCNGEMPTTPVLSRSGRAASKAANVKIKESQRLLNDLSSKRRRPETAEEQQNGVAATDEAQSSKRKNKRDHSDSGVYDRYSTCSNASTTSTRSTRNQRGATNSNKAAAAPEIIVIQEEDNSTPADGRKVDFDVRHGEVVSKEKPSTEEENEESEDIKKSSDKIRKRSSLSHADEPSKKISKTDSSPNTLSNNLTHSEKVCRVGLVPLDAASVDKAEQSSKSSRTSNNRRSNSLQARHSRTSSSLPPRGKRSSSSSSSNKSNINADNLMECPKSPQPEDCEQMPYLIEPPQEFSEKAQELVCDVQPEKAQGLVCDEQPEKAQEPVCDEQPEFKQPEVPVQIKSTEIQSPPKPQPRTTRTKTRKVERLEEQEAVKSQSVTTTTEQERPSRVARTKKRAAEDNEDQRPKRDSSISSLHSESSTASSSRSTRTKKRKLEEQQRKLEAKPVSDLLSRAAEVCIVSSDSENDEGNINPRLPIGSGTSTAASQNRAVRTPPKTHVRAALNDPIGKKSPLPAKNPFTGGNNSKRFVSTLGMVEESIRNSCPNVVSVCVSPLHEAVIKSAASPRGISKQHAPLLDCHDEVHHKSISDRDDTNRTDESFDETEEEEEQEEEEEEEEEEEPEILLQPPRRMTRSKVRLQQQQVSTKAADSPVPAEKLQAAAKSKKQLATNGKFSPRPFSNRTGVKQLAAAYTDHVVSASTPLAKGQSRGLVRVSSTSRLPHNTNRLMNTPQTINRIRALHPSGGLSSSNDSHHYRHISKVVTPSQSNRPKNLVVSGMKSFLSSSVAVQPARPTREELQELREEDIRRKMEKEEETLRKREERLRAKGNEAKKRNEERMRKVQEARMANERKAAELKESLEKEKRKQQLREKRLREEKAREEAHKKKVAMLKKAEEEKRRREEELRRREEEALRKREEAEERRREEADRRAALLREQEEQRLEEERLAEEARLTEEKRRVVEEKQRREAERQAREKEEMKLLKEREAARLAAAAVQQQQQQKKAVPLNQTFDANSTYIAGGAAVNTTYTAVPKTPASSRPESYEMTPALDCNDYGIEDLKSEDSSDDDSNPKKKVPKWATRLELHRTLVNQEYSNIDLDRVFPCQYLLLLPDLSMIFKIKRSRFKVRSSSAHWTTPPHKIFSTKVMPQS